MGTDEWFESRSDEEKAALRAGALSYPERKMQRYGHDWREAGAFDWTGCDQVEVVPGKVSGVPVLVRTRMPADSVLQHFEWDESPEEIADQFDLSLQDVVAVLQFAGVLDRVAVSA
jgi:uncharacterized protein (DUF433 family)